MFILLTGRFAFGTIKRLEVAASIFLVSFDDPATWLFTYNIRRASMQAFIALFCAQRLFLHIFHMSSAKLRCLHLH